MVTTNDHCGKKPISGLGVCIRTPGHDTGHNPTDHEDAAGRMWLARKSSKGNPLLRSEIKRGKPVKRRSPKGDERNGWLQAILYGKLAAQHGRFPDYRCESCGESFGTDIEEALAILQPGHIEERRHDPGQGVRFGSGGKVTRIGTDSWDNLSPICSVCNEAQDRNQRSEPEWTPNVR